MLCRACQYLVWPSQPPLKKRVALVVGNSAYAHAAVLANPVNDAADIAAALQDQASR